MSFAIDILSWFLLSAGGIFILIGGIGVMRLPDFYTRMHAASLTDTAGALLIISAIILQSGFTLATLKLMSILIFLLLTGPTASYSLANTALLSGLKPFKVKPKDEALD